MYKPTYTVSSIQANPYLRANTLLFQKRIAEIKEKLNKLADLIKGTYMEFQWANRHEGPVVTLHGKIDGVEVPFKEVVSAILNVFPTAEHVHIKDNLDNYEEEVFIYSSGPVLLELRCSKDSYKIPFVIYVPVIVEPGQEAETSDVKVVFKYIRPERRVKTMRVGNTVVVPLKRELSLIGNPREVDVLIDTEGRKIIIEPADDNG